MHKDGVVYNTTNYVSPELFYENVFSVESVYRKYIKVRFIKIIVERCQRSVSVKDQRVDKHRSGRQSHIDSYKCC